MKDKNKPASFLSRILCRLIGHTFELSCDAKTLRTSKGRYIRTEYRHMCALCGHKSPWIRRSRINEWRSTRRFV